MRNADQFNAAFNKGIRTPEDRIREEILNQQKELNSIKIQDAMDARRQ